MPLSPLSDYSITSPEAPASVSGGGGSSSGSNSSGSGGTSVGEKAGSSPTQHFSTGLFQILRGAADRAEYGPPVKIGPRDTVTIEPLPTNTVNCFYGTTPDAAKFGPRAVLAPSGVPRAVRVRNLNELNVYSTVQGEGAVIEVQRG